MTGPTALLRTLPLLAVLLAAMLGPAAPARGQTLEAVRERGLVRCGVSTGVVGFSRRDEAGRWRGFDVDFCRAVAAAVLGEADRVDYRPAPVQSGLTALARGELDLLSRTVTITLRRVTELGLTPVGVNYFDGQGFLVHGESGIRTLRQLQGLRICFQSGTTAEDNLKEHLSARRIAYVPVAIAEFGTLIRTFLDGGCEAVSADSSALAAIRVSALPPVRSYRILRQQISKEPFGPLVRAGDTRWLEILRWTLMAQIEAEELGVSSANLEAQSASDNPRVRRLLGLTPGLGAALGLDEPWAARIIRQVGNYGESFETNLGQASPLKLDRGLNQLWTRGGLLFAYPLR
jgi:general L-amino acid transport system substrate-binding protein